MADHETQDSEPSTQAIISDIDNVLGSQGDGGTCSQMLSTQEIIAADLGTSIQISRTTEIIAADVGPSSQILSTTESLSSDVGTASQMASEIFTTNVTSESEEIKKKDECPDSCVSNIEQHRNDTTDDIPAQYHNSKSTKKERSESLTEYHESISRIQGNSYHSKEMAATAVNENSGNVLTKAPSEILSQTPERLHKTDSQNIDVENVTDTSLLSQGKGTKTSDGIKSPFKDQVQHTQVDTVEHSSEYTQEISNKEDMIFDQNLSKKRQLDETFNENTNGSAISQKEEYSLSKKAKVEHLSQEEINSSNSLVTDDLSHEFIDTSKFEKDFTHKPAFLTGTVSEFDAYPGNYLKGCKWSPDGTCILTNSEDNKLRVFNLPEPLYHGKCEHLSEMNAVLKMQEAELIYDYCWFPKMSSAHPDTCLIASTSRDNPVHLWDAFNGSLRGSYRAYDQADELIAANSLAFSLDGGSLYCGFNKLIRVFDVSRPGRESQKRPTFVKQGQPGIISCIAMNPSNPGIYAAGSYSRSIALYSNNKGDMICMFLGQQGGVTHIAYSPDGNKLYSGGRKDPELLCWDLRSPGRILFSARRLASTNQRVYFCLDPTGRHLVSGQSNGTVSVWDTLAPPVEVEDAEEPSLTPVMTYQAHSDMVNGVSLHPTMPYLATASGQRHFFPPGGIDSSSESDDEAGREEEDNSLRMWWIGT